jgi:hypothetical protein
VTSRHGYFDARVSSFDAAWRKIAASFCETTFSRAGTTAGVPERASLDRETVSLRGETTAFL